MLYNAPAVFPQSGSLGVARIKRTDASKLQDEYAKLVEGLQEAADDEDSFVSNPGKQFVCLLTAAANDSRDSQCCPKIFSKRPSLGIYGKQSTLSRSSSDL